MEFTATVELHGRTATGIEVPEEVVAELGDSRRPAVTITVNGYAYRTTVARMGGKFLVPLSAEHRSAAGVEAGEQVRVGIELDTAARTTEVPDDLATALASSPEARATYDGCSPSQQKEWVRWITEAKKPQTRAARVERAIGTLAAGGRTR